MQASREQLEIGEESPREKLTTGVRQSLGDTERPAMQNPLRRTGWNVSEAARLMRIPKRTLHYRMGKLRVRRGSR